MIWNSWSDFFAMGGYALFVWGSLGVVFACLGVEMLLLAQRSRQVRTELLAAQRRRGGAR